MRRRRRFTVLLVALAVVVLTLALASGAMATSLYSLDVPSGETYVVGDMTTLQHLTIAEGGVLKAAPGYSVTMLVNGVETGGGIAVFDTGEKLPLTPFDPPGATPAAKNGGYTIINPGSYHGNIALYVTPEMLLDRGAPFGPGNEPFQWPYRTGLYIDGGVVKAKSVLAAVQAGTVTDTYASGLKMTSTGDYFNGVMFMGDSNYVLYNPMLSFTGNGHDDFGGFGAAIRVAGTSNVTINRATIITDGVTRSAVWVGGEGTAIVNDSRIETGLGTLPADWLGGPFPPGTGGSMLTVPWMLGISGNCRATSVVSSGSATYNNCYIQAQQWGALSTDMCRGGKLTANNSMIKVLESGYGAYNDQQCDDYFDKTTFDVPDYGLIHTGPGTSTFTNQCVVNSDRWGIMFHGGAPGTVNINKGSVFNTGLTTFLMKNSYPTLNIDNAALNPGNGIILHSMLSDDPMSPDQSGGDTAIDANFSNMTVTGDIVNTNTTKCDVNVKLTNVVMTGAITTGTQQFLGVYPRTMDTRTDIGMVSTTYAPTSDAYGITASVDAGSTWVVTKTSYLTSLSFGLGGIQAPAGYRISLTVNGKPMGFKPGSYMGAIVVKVTPVGVFGGTSLSPQVLPVTE